MSILWKTAKKMAVKIPTKATRIISEGTKQKIQAAKNSNFSKKLDRTSRQEAKGYSHDAETAGIRKDQAREKIKSTKETISKKPVRTSQASKQRSK